MKLAMMQPYFFPYIGYFELIHIADQWVVFDTAQYIRHGWINRNRTLHPVSGWQYVIVPIRKHSQQTAIKDIQIAEDIRWRTKLLGRLQHYKGAPFFTAVMNLIGDCVRDAEDSLNRLNVRCLESVCSYLDIPFRFSLLSEMKLGPFSVERPGEWALRIAEALGASEYINAPGGTDLFEPSRFEEAGIKLAIQKPSDFVYDCDGYEFQPNLSIIDVMMWNSPSDVRNYLLSRGARAMELKQLTEGKIHSS